MSKFDNNNFSSTIFGAANTGLHGRSTVQKTKCCWIPALFLLFVGQFERDHETGILRTEC